MSPNSILLVQRANLIVQLLLKLTLKPPTQVADLGRKNVMLKYALTVQLSIVLRRSLKEMPAVEVGRICVKLFGRETGRKCVIIDVMDKSFVLVTGPKKVTGVKRRRVKINHVSPLQDRIEH